MAAGVTDVPEASQHTSINQRVEHVEAHGRTADLKAARRGSVAGSGVAMGLEETLWLCPIKDRRRLNSSREGMLGGFSLGNYLLLVDYTGRLFREGKAVISRELVEIFDRLGSSAENWQARLVKLAGCWAGSSRPAGSASERSPSVLACGKSPTWPDAWPADTGLGRGSQSGSQSVRRLAAIPNPGLAGNLPDFRWPGTLKRAGP